MPLDLSGRAVAARTGLAVALFALACSPAAAHAALVAASPADGERREHAPAQVRLDFDEPVETAVGAVRVFDDDGHERTAERPHHPDGTGSAVAVGLPPLEPGRYTVAWQVVSADGHLVGGAYRFGVGVTVAPGEAAAAVPPADPAGTAILAAVRLLALGALLLGIGLAAAAALVQRPGTPLAVPAAEFAAWMALAVAAFADAVVRTSLAGGSAALLVSTRFGVFRVTESLAALVAAAAVAGRRRRWPLLAGAAGTAVAAQVLSGHASTGDLAPLGVAADAAHLLGASVWIGALAWTAARPASVIARRTSILSTAAVAVLSAGGVAAAIRLVGTPAALLASDYGRLVLAKTAVFGLALASAAVARRSVARGLDARALAGPVRLELGLLVVVLGLTAVLVDGRPPRGVVPPAPVGGSFTVAGLRVDVTAEPAGKGRFRLRVATRGSDGAPRAADEVAAELRESTRGVGPFALTVLPSGRASAYGAEVVLPFAGRWTLAVRARSGEFDEDHLTITLPEEP